MKTATQLGTWQEKVPKLERQLLPIFCITAIAKPITEITKYTRDGLHN